MKKMQENYKQKVIDFFNSRKAVDQLIAEKGIWQESINLYIKAWK